MTLEGKAAIVAGGGQGIGEGIVICLAEEGADISVIDINGENAKKVAGEVKRSGGIFIDLFPVLKGKNARGLWVHPTDQHPGEKVHRIAAELIANHILENRKKFGFDHTSEN